MFFKKREYTTGTSLSKLAWKKLLMNKIAIASICFIFLISFIATLGYLITPDSSPYANSQSLELASLKPGSRINVLRIKKNRIIEKSSLLRKMLFGKSNDYESIPYVAYYFHSDKIGITEYSTDSIEDPRIFDFVLAEVCDHLISESYRYDSLTQTANYLTSDSLKKSYHLAELQDLVIRNHLKTKRFILGTDRYGRDYLSRLMIGARVSLSVGFIAVSISLLIGIFLGSLAGFFRSWIDQLIVWFINVVWSIPTLLLVIAITFALGRGFWQVFIAVGLTMWVEIARIVRGQILAIREKEFVEAGRALGFNNFRIIFYHILPNIMSPIIVISAANFASAILIEAGLSFLGIGVQPPMPSWGSMIKENYAYIILDSAYLAIIPGIAIMLMVLAFMLLGNSLREALDVRIQNRNE